MSIRNTNGIQGVPSKRTRRKTNSGLKIAQFKVVSYTKDTEVLALLYRVSVKALTISGRGANRFIKSGRLLSPIRIPEIGGRVDMSFIYRSTLLFSDMTLKWLDVLDLFEISRV